MTFSCPYPHCKRAVPVAPRTRYVPVSHVTPTGEPCRTMCLDVRPDDNWGDDSIWDLDGNSPEYVWP